MKKPILGERLAPDKEETAMERVTPSQNSPRRQNMYHLASDPHLIPRHIL
jgi:hypothetical protein